MGNVTTCVVDEEVKSLALRSRCKQQRTLPEIAGYGSIHVDGTLKENNNGMIGASIQFVMRAHCMEPARTV